jgi:hypothetical protein
VSRRSYSGVSAKPAWLLYTDEELVASVRADHADEAWKLFWDAGLRGTHMRRADSQAEVRAAQKREAERMLR